MTERWTIDPVTRRLVWPSGELLVATDWTLTKAEWAAQHWPACPVCGTTVDVEQVDVTNRVDGEAVMVGRWSCSHGCDPRSATTCPVCGSRAVADQVHVPTALGEDRWVPGLFRCTNGHTFTPATPR